MRIFGILVRLLLVLCLTTMLASCGDSGNGSPPVFSTADSHNVTYVVGQYIEYAVTGHMVGNAGTANEGNTFDTNGTFRIDIADEGTLYDKLINPNIKVLTMIESQNYVISMKDKSGKVTPMPVGGYAFRYFTQDSNGTVNFYGETTLDGTNMIYYTTWFKQPYIQYVSPFSVGASKTTNYEKFAVASDGTVTSKGAFVSSTSIDGTENIATPIGVFTSYKMAFVSTVDNNPRTQYIYPKIGIIRFTWPAWPNYTGNAFEMTMTKTNIAY